MVFQGWLHHWYLGVIKSPMATITGRHSAQLIWSLIWKNASVETTGQNYYMQSSLIIDYDAKPVVAQLEVAVLETLKKKQAVGAMG